MGDYTYYRLVVADADRLDAQLLARVVAAFIDEDFGVQDVARCGFARADGCMVFDIEERPVGQCRAAADAVYAVLAGGGVEVGFAVCEEPKYEWLGTLCRYFPGTGMHEVECGPGGDPLIELTTVRALAARHRQPEELVEAITAHLGADLPLLIH